jgi:hypothetical protein
MREVTIFEYAPRTTYNYSEATKMTEADYWKSVDKIRTAYLGPWCPDCGKKGKKCRNRETCRLRSIVSYKAPRFLTLPKPTDEWMAEKGYGTLTTSYHAGGRWKTGGRRQLRCFLSEARMRDAVQEYAYEVEMGRVETEAVAA